MKIEVSNLKKSFDGNEVLHGLSFSMESGKALGLLGRNGAGKTTTIRILMDVFKADSGKISVDGKPFHSLDYLIGYMPEERGMYPKKKILSQLIYFGELKGMKKADAKARAKCLLQRLGMEDLENRRLETLSKGNQQKIQLIETLLADPQIIILDEPFSGLDPVNSKILKELIQEEINKGKLVVFSSHQMGYVEEFCEDIVILNHGEIVISGKLSKIQEEMGANRGIIKASSMDNETLSHILKEKMKEYLYVEDVRKEYVVYRMLVSKQEIMRRIAELDIDIALFGDYRPSLTDIFVWKAGE